MNNKLLWNTAIPLAIIFMVMGLSIAMAEQEGTVTDSRPEYTKEYEKIPYWCMDKYDGQDTLTCVETQQQAFLRVFDYIGCALGSSGSCLADPVKCLPVSMEEVDWTLVESCIIGEVSSIPAEEVSSSIQATILEVYQSPVNTKVKVTPNGRKPANIYTY